MSLFQQIKSTLVSLFTSGSRDHTPGHRSTATSTAPVTSSALGMNRRNVSVVHPGNPRPLRKWADDKALTKARLIEHDLPVPPTYAVVSSVGEIRDAWERVRSLDSFVVKPTGGRAGNGILVLQRAMKDGKAFWKTPSGGRMNAEQIQRHMADLVSGVASTSGWGRALIEYRVTIDDTFYQIYPRGLTDIRVITHHAEPVLAMARIPTDEADGRANLHQGALGAGIDIRSGMMSAAYDYKGYLAEHPDTYVSIEGVKIKDWPDILEICTRTARAVPLEYLGVDLVLDADRGPMIMEINARPGLEIQNVTRQGLRDVLHTPT